MAINEFEHSSQYLADRFIKCTQNVHSVGDNNTVVHAIRFIEGKSDFREDVRLQLLMWAGFTVRRSLISSCVRDRTIVFELAYSLTP